MGWSKFNYTELMYCASITSPPCPPNDITISRKGSSHYPSCSTNGRDISACLFQPTRNTDPTQTANRSSCCCHGNSILPSLLPRGASFNSITRPGETVSKRAYPCNSVLRPTLSSFPVTVRTVHYCGYSTQTVIAVIYLVRTKKGGQLFIK